jgi:subtilisin family serine protease
MRFRFKLVSAFIASSVALWLLPIAGGAQDRTPIGGDYVAGELLVGFVAGASSEDEDSAVRSVGAFKATAVTASLRKLQLGKGRESAVISALRKNPKVRFAEPNYIVHAIQTVPNDPSFGQLWAMRNTGQAVNGTSGTAGADISATPAWDISTGTRSVVVGDVDTGIDYNHQDLAANVWSNPGGVGSCAAGTHGYNAITTTCEVMDDNNHGSHTAGTIGAVGNNGVGVAGVNWTTSLMGLKFLDKNGSGSLANAISAIDFAVTAKNKGQANVRALNNSWGGGGFSQALLDEINKAGANDILFVAAAGNNSLNHGIFSGYPCDYGYWNGAANVVCVAASDQNDNLASFSDYGTGVHLAAPGTNVYSTIPGNAYAYYNGTSMATPHVTGAAALILSVCNINTAGVKNAILNNVDTPAGLSGLVMTNGRLNLNKAIRSCAPTAPDFSISASPASQTVTQGSSTSYTVTIARTGGFTGAVTLNASGLAAGVTATFSTNPIPATATTSTMTVATSSTTPVASSTLTITGTGTGVPTHSTTVTLVVQAPPTPDFSISASPSSQTLNQGASTSYTVTIARTGGFADTVTLTTSGLPAGATVSYSANPIPANSTTSTMTVATASTTPTGSYTLTISGSGTGVPSHSTTVTLAVQTVPTGDFSLSVSPSSRAIDPGTSGTYTVNINRTNGFTGTVTFTVGGLRNGATYSLPASSGNSATLTVNVLASDPGDFYSFTITGVSGSLSRNTTAQIDTTGG